MNTRTFVAFWYRVAAKEKCAIAEFNLGFVYADGLGASKDFSRALKWWLLARAEAPPGRPLRNKAHHWISVLQSQMTPAEIQRGHALAANELAARQTR